MRNGLSGFALQISYVVLASIAVSAHDARADTACSTAPKSKFQDRAKIDDILKPKGLMINKINEDHGCYKVIAVTREFKKITLIFNAETLKPVDTGSSDLATQDQSATQDAETDGD